MPGSLGESIARRRVFWFLVALVVGPTLLLATYGLAGLKDQRDATVARLRDRYLLQSRVLEQQVIARLAEEDALLRRSLATGGTVGGLVRPSGLIDAAWRLTDPDVPEPILAAGIRADPGAPLTFTSLDTPDGVELVGLSTLAPGDVVAWRIRPETIDAIVVPALVGRLFPHEPASYHVLPGVSASTGEPISAESIRRQLSERLLAPEVDRPMGPPFDSLRITIAAQEDPTVSSGTRNILVVFVLVAAVVAGITLLGRALAQQVRLSRLQADFVSHVSHELRTPLTSIRMFLETLQSGRVTDPDRVRECLDILAEESDRLNRKIERLLSWARLEAGRRLYDMAPRRPIELVDATLAAFRAQQLDGGAPVAVDVPADLPAVRVDQEAMEEVLLNLLSNARKYGGPPIRIVGNADSRWVTLSVSDGGPGIPAAERKRIFEKFYRPDLLQVRRQAGSGLGLAIVKAIVSAHRGKVEVESEEGKGATFRIRLRRV